MQPSTKPDSSLTWQEIQEQYEVVATNSRARLESEAGALGVVDLEDVPVRLLGLAPETAVDLFHRRNPHLPLSRVGTMDPYPVAVGVLRMLAPAAEPEAAEPEIAEPETTPLP